MKTNSPFQFKSFSQHSLKEFGFAEQNGVFFYETPIMQDQFLLRVVVEHNEISSRVFDLATEEEFVLYRVEDAVGTFVGEVRKEADVILRKIAEQCCYHEIFKWEQTKRLLAYGREKYGTSPEHLWADTPENAILRRKDTKKWYCAILTVNGKKLGLADRRMEIINLHTLPERLPSLLETGNYFPAYHMNKKQWFSLPLDGRVSDEELFFHVNESYSLAKK